MRRCCELLSAVVFSWVVGTLLFVVLVVGCAPVQAFTITAASPAMVQTGASSFSVQDAGANAIASASRTWATDGVILSASDSVPMAGLGGEMAVAVTEGATADAAVAAVVGCITTVVCAAAVATVAVVATAYRMRTRGDGSVDVDPGVPPTLAPGYAFEPGTPCQSVDMATAAKCDLKQQLGNTWTFSNCDANGCGYFIGGSPHYIGMFAYPAQVPSCADGVSQPGFDGRCASGVYQPESPATAVQALRSAGVGLASPGVAQAAQDAVTIGGQSMPAAQVKLSGPATQAGPAVVTQTATKTDAQGNTVTSTQTAAPSYIYTYNPDGTVTAQTSTTTAVQNSDGSSSTSTAVSPAGSSGAGSSTGTPTPGLCDAYPGIVACSKLGDAPTDQVPTGSVSAPGYVPEAVDLPVGCPAPVVVAGQSVSYQPICVAATQARPWVLIGAAFSALMLVVAVVRTM